MRRMARNFLENIQGRLRYSLETIDKAWWVEIVTEKPNCIYYFGPFVTQITAEFASSGYLEDLEQERPQVITLGIKRCQPEQLTIFEDE